MGKKAAAMRMRSRKISMAARRTSSLLLEIPALAAGMAVLVGSEAYSRAALGAGLARCVGLEFLCLLRGWFCCVCHENFLRKFSDIERSSMLMGVHRSIYFFA